MGLVSDLNPVAYTSISGGTTTAMSLPGIPAGTAYAFISVEGQAARYRVDGPDPTDSEGHLLAVGEGLELGAKELRNIRIRSTSTVNPTTIRVTYYAYR